MKPFAIRTQGSIPPPNFSYSVGEPQQLNKALVQPQNQFCKFGQLTNTTTYDTYFFAKNVVITSIQVFGDPASATGTQMLLKSNAPGTGGVQTFWGMYLRSTSAVFKEYQERTFNPPYFVPCADGTTIEVSAIAIPAGNTIKYCLIGYEVDF